MQLGTANNLAVMSEDKCPEAPDIRQEGGIVRMRVIWRGPQLVLFLSPVSVEEHYIFCAWSLLSPGQAGREGTVPMCLSRLGKGTPAAETYRSLDFPCPRASVPGSLAAARGEV